MTQATQRGWQLLVLSTAFLLLSGTFTPAFAARAPYSKGDPVTITGRVTDSDGKPVANVTVLLELSRKAFQLRKLRRIKGNTLRVPVNTTADGGFRHDWQWDGYYNTFELAVAMPTLRGGHDQFEVIHRTEITQPILQGRPVNHPIVLEDTSYLEWFRRFLDGRASAEEKRVFDEMGRPGRIDVHGDEAYAWWYFEAGKVYRFRAGALEQIEPFDPIGSP